MDIQDNVFLVTGGASGLGAATAKLIRHHGGQVVIADMNEAGGETAREGTRRRVREVRCEP